MKNFSIIVAVDDKMGIGFKGQLPWHLSADLRHFALVTKNAVSGAQNAVIMGRKTWESLPERFRPLPDRINVVLTRDLEYALPQGVFRADSLDGALSFLEDFSIDQTFVIGGAQLFQEAIVHPCLEQIYVTHVFGIFSCDVFFPVILAERFEKIEQSEVYEENDIKFQFDKYRKRL